MIYSVNLGFHRRTTTSEGNKPGPWGACRPSWRGMIPRPWTKVPNRRVARQRRRRRTSRPLPRAAMPPPPTMLPSSPPPPRPRGQSIAWRGAVPPPLRSCAFISGEAGAGTAIPAGSSTPSAAPCPSQRPISAAARTAIDGEDRTDDRRARGTGRGIDARTRCVCSGSPLPAAIIIGILRAGGVRSRSTARACFTSYSGGTRRGSAVSRCSCSGTSWIAITFGTTRMRERRHRRAARREVRIILRGMTRADDR